MILQSSIFLCCVSFFGCSQNFDDIALSGICSVLSNCFFVFGVRCPAMVLQRLLSDFGRPKRARTTTMAEEEAGRRRAASKHEAIDEGHHPEWSMRLNSVQHEKNHQVPDTTRIHRLIAFFFIFNVVRAWPF